MPHLKDTAPPRVDQVCPPNSWDVHHHIFDLVKFPLSPTRHFTPSSAPLAAFEAFQHAMGIEHPCIAHGLSFGTDSSSLVSYMDHFEGSARAYACVDIETVSDKEILALKGKGILGLRIDLHLHKAQHDVNEQISCLCRYAAIVAPFGWGLQLYHPHPEYYSQLAPIIRDLPTSLVIDHFGGLKTKSLLEYQGIISSEFDPSLQPGLSDICGLLRDGKMWIKLSAPYRCSEDPTYQDMRPLVRALVDANPDRVLYGSDWPHTLPFHRRPVNLKGTDVETFLPFDDAAWVKTLRSWLSEAEWVKLMVDNPRRFTGYEGLD